MVGLQLRVNLALTFLSRLSFECSREGGEGAGLKLDFQVSGVICENLVEKFQQLGEMGEDCNFPHWGFVAKMLSKYKKIVYSLPLFGVRYKRIVKLEV